MNARDRIGKGPWVNVKGETVAKNVDDLHADPAINKQTALTEKGAVVNGRGDSPNQHDILTGSTPEGRAPAGEADATCGNWTKGGEGSAIVGHHDRMGLDQSAAGEIVEFVAPLPRLQRGGAGVHRRVGAALLLRGELRAHAGLLLAGAVSRAR